METVWSATLTGSLGLVVLVVTLIGVLLSRLYQRASKEVAFVRTGWGGEKVVMDGGSLVFPVLHERIPVNLNTLRLEVQRQNEEALITHDRMRVNVKAEFYVRVTPTDAAIAAAAQTLGRRTMAPQDLRELVEGKFVDALRAVAAAMTMEELHEQRTAFAQRVQTTVSEDLTKNGLELETVSLTALDQTDQNYFNPQNAFDAQGLTKLTEEIETRKRRRNEIERDTEVAMREKDLQAAEAKLTLERQEEVARLAQQREIAVRRAEETTLTATREAAQQREAEAARILAKQQIDQAAISAERQVAEDRIAKTRQVREQEIVSNQVVETAEIGRQQAVTLAEQSRAIAVAEKSKDESVAEAEADRARAIAATEAERVVTARNTEVAERDKAIALIAARQQAEHDAIGVTVAAEAERRASEDQAQAIRIVAEAEADKVKITADAAERRYSVDAAGTRALHEAENVLAAPIIEMRVKTTIVEHLEHIIRESVKPIEAIEGIKIIQVAGLTAGMAVGNGQDAGISGNLAEQAVNSALRYRAQAPVLDALLKEIATIPGRLGTGGEAAKKKGGAQF